MARLALADAPSHRASFPSRRRQLRYWFILAGLVVLALALTYGLLAWKNPMPPGTERFWLIARSRINAVIAMLIVAVCQPLATIAFQTVTANRLITPSILGFEALYTALFTSVTFFYGASGLVEKDNLALFLLSLALMVVCSMLLYSWLLWDSRSSMHAMLLVGIVIGGGLGSLSTFMQRMLDPSDFDVLSARLFGSVNNADPDYFPVVIPLVAVTALAMLLLSRRLNVLSLGRDTAMCLGLNYRVYAVLVLALTSMLMGVSTSLVGPMVFLGFLVATLTYQLADTFDHRYLLPMSMVLCYVVFAGGYFVLNNFFRVAGAVSIIIELIGGSVFLILLLRKGRL